MKVLLDECTPHVLKRLLTDVEISTVQELGWSGITNGSLLKRAEGQFDVLITSDQNWKHQQNVAGVQIAIIQLHTNQVPKVIALAPAVHASLRSIQPGGFVAIAITADHT
jgi:predicted nuclease of predicted toxin-antitoxin system